MWLQEGILQSPKSDQQGGSEPEGLQDSPTGHGQETLKVDAKARVSRQILAWPLVTRAEPTNCRYCRGRI